MHLYMWRDLIMPARLFHTPNIAELAEALELKREAEKTRSRITAELEQVPEQD